jgi:phage terminase large subunit-like protein
METELLSLAERTDHYGRQLIKWGVDWSFAARPEQLFPAGNWINWLILSGRGWGKTRTGAEIIGYMGALNTGWRLAVVAPTQSDVRRTCFEGESGLLARIPPFFVKKYSSTDLEIELVNGSLLAGFSAEKPDRLRGPQFHAAWCDELASWGASNDVERKNEARRLEETWANLEFCLRLGTHPRKVITTTPRPIEFLRNLAKDTKHTFVTQRPTFDNDMNLAKSAIETFRRVYDGTRRGQQELYGEILDSNEHALWKWEQLEHCRVEALPEGVTYLAYVVAIDPAVTTEDDSDETGIIGAGLGDDGIIYVEHDISGHHAPRAWARAALTLYERTQADSIVSETNQGGDLVEANLRGEAEDRWFAYKGVHAKRGKYLRAEPIAAYYEKGKVRHIGRFPKLEKQMTDFTGSSSAGSPDRLDALVYAIGELMTRTVRHAFW